MSAFEASVVAGRAADFALFIAEVAPLGMLALAVVVGAWLWAD